MTTEKDPAWFITGCSSGFGRALAKLVIDHGWRAAVTARNSGQIEGLVASCPERGIALALDVTDPAQVAAAVQAAAARFGAIDVLVNNAGYGYQTSVEEGDDVAVRALFEANVFGLAALIRAVLPGMRTRRRGHIVNISSVAGFVGYPGSGDYVATKHLKPAPLRDIKVLEVCTLLLGPAGPGFLGAMGATVIKCELPLKRMPKPRRWFAHYRSGIGEFGGSRTNWKHSIEVCGWCVLTIHRNEYHDRSDAERAEEYLNKWAVCEKELRGLRLLQMGDAYPDPELRKLLRESFGVNLDEGTVR